MLTSSVKDVAVPARIVPLSERVEKLKLDRPVFAVEGEKIYAVDRRAAGSAPRTARVRSFARRVEQVPPATPLYRAARLLLSWRVDALPVGRKGITDELVARAVKDTRQVAKTPAGSIASPIPVVKDSTLSKAENIASKGDYEVLPVVNASGHLVGLWRGGEVHRKFRVVREGTRVRAFIDQALQSPVVVVDKHRKPIGMVGKRELLELAASLREFDIPICYVGKDELGSRAGLAEREVEHAAAKIVKLLPVRFITVRFSRKGVWQVSVKVSHTGGTLMASKESETFEKALSAALNAVLRQARK